METPNLNTDIADRLREGLSRIATVLRADDWARAAAVSLNPAQLAILELLAGRSGGLGVKAVAFQLGVSQPSATDSISALDKKGLIAKHTDAGDRRIVQVRVTAKGRAALKSAEATPSAAASAVAALPADRQSDLLANVIAVIRELQEVGAIPIQRMCVSCRHFVPNAHGANAARPHHCRLVDMALAGADLRVDCREHEAADPAARAAIWKTLEKKRPSPAHTEI